MHYKLVIEDSINCHNKGAPFEDISFSAEDVYQDGFESGSKFALNGEFYTAAGPHVEVLQSFLPKNCVHWIEYCRLTKIRNKIWCKGWEDGQNSNDPIHILNSSCSEKNSNLKQRQYRMPSRISKTYIDINTGKFINCKVGDFIEVHRRDAKVIKIQYKGMTILVKD